jgi:ribosomal protein L12E/L44/L45/RPP1/RPP2
MEYIYAALLLHKLGQTVNEENIKKVVVAAAQALRLKSQVTCS